MPFTDDTYSLPNGSLVTTGLRSAASQHNTPFTDIADALTTVKTAATSATDAVTALEAREIAAGTGLTGGGDLADNMTISLDSTSIASLENADSAVQPARTVTGDNGLTGGGDLSEDRTIGLDAASIASLAKADSAVQTLVAGQSTSIDNADPQNPVVAFTGTGTGDMIEATYDPQNVKADAFDRANHTGPNTPDDGSVSNEKLSAPLLTLAQTRRTPVQFGAKGNDTGDDTAAILAALKDGPVIGDKGAVYRISSQLVLPTDVESFFDLNGATIHSTWNGNYPFRGVAPTFVTSVVSGGINPGTRTVGVNDASGFSVGDEVFVDFNGPVQIRKIVGKSGGTLTVDRPWDHDTAGGVITLYKCAFRPKFSLMNGTIDFGSVPVGRAGFSYIDHWESQLFQELDFVNFLLDTNGTINVPWRSREVMLDHCKFLDAKSGQFMSAFKNETVTMRDNYGRGDAFALAISFSSAAHFIGNHIEGRFFATNDPPSTRGIKPTWCQGGTIVGNTVRGYDSGMKIEDCGGFAITGNVVEWCGTGINVSNQNPSSRTVGHLVEGNNLRFIQGVCAIQVTDTSVIAHKVANNLIYRPKGDGIRGDATYIGITDNHIIEYGYDPAAPGTPDVTKYPIVLTGASQLGVMDGNYAYAGSPSTAQGYYVAATASNFRIGLNYGNLPAERLYQTIPAPSKNADVFLPGGRIKKTFEAALTTSYANYSFPTAFPHGFLAFEGAFPIDGPSSNTAGSVVCDEAATNTNASQVRLAAAAAGTYRITVIGY